MPLINWVKITTFLESVGAAPTNYIPISAIPVDNGVAPFAEAAKRYASVQEMLDDGWLATDDAVLAATQVFGQTAFTITPPTRVVIVNRAAPVAQVEEFTVNAADDGTYKLYISILGGSPVEAASFTALTNTVTDIKDGLIADFNLGPFAGTHTAADVDIDSGSVTADFAGVPFVLTGDGPNGAADITVDNTTPNSGIYEDLDAAFLVEPFWGVIPDPAEVEGVMIEVSRWTEASAAINSPRRNVAFLQTDDTDILSATEPNFASTLVGLGRTRAFPLVHANLSDKMTAAWFGRYGGQFPGSRAWHFGQLTGSTETDNLIYTETQVENAVAQRASIVERDAPSTLAPLRVNWGQGTGGFFVVQKQAEDYWWLRVGQAMVNQLESATGVNLDEEGIDKLVAAVEAVNTELGSNDPPVIDLLDTSVTPVPLEDVPDAEKAVGDYATTGGIEVSTTLIPKLRRVRVSATFALA